MHISWLLRVFSFQSFFGCSRSSWAHNAFIPISLFSYRWLPARSSYAEESRETATASPFGTENKPTQPEPEAFSKRSCPVPVAPNQACTTMLQADHGKCPKHLEIPWVSCRVVNALTQILEKPSFRGQQPQIPLAALGFASEPPAAAAMLTCLQERSLLVGSEDVGAYPCGF